MSASNSTCVFCTPFVLLDSSDQGRQAFLDLAGCFHDDFASFELEQGSGDGQFTFDHADSIDAYESLSFALSEFAKSISPLIGSAFKFTVRNLDTGEDERDEDIYAGPTPESIERLKKQEAIVNAIDALKQCGAPGLQKYISLLEGSINDELKEFVVEIVKQDSTKVIRFECQAEDEVHARETVTLAHPQPDVHIVNVFLKSAELELTDEEETDALVKRAEDAGYEILKDTQNEGQWVWWHPASATRSNGCSLDPRYVSREAAARGALQCEADDRVTIDLHLSVDYKLNGESIDLMLSDLERRAVRAIGAGILTGDSAAEVEQHTMGVSVRPDIDEDELTEFMNDRIENGSLNLEELPRRLAHYGLMQPALFVGEMKERMQELEFGRFSFSDEGDKSDTTAPAA